jgi:hypothetical protein
MGRRRRLNDRVGAAPQASLVPFTPEQRRYLRGQLAVCCLAVLILAATALLFLAAALDPQSSASRSVAWLFVLLPGLFLALISLFALKYLRDLRLGGALVQTAYLQEIVWRRGVAHQLVFAEIGPLHRVLTAGHRFHVSGEEVGRRWSVTYSPSSRTVWALGGREER